jgi:hypothetical protein
MHEFSPASQVQLYFGQIKSKALARASSPRFANPNCSQPNGPSGRFSWLPAKKP